MASKKPIKDSRYYAPQCLLKWYYSKIATKYGASTELAKYCNCTQAFITAVMSRRAPIPILLAIKLSIYSKLYLGDICPVIDPYIADIAQQYYAKSAKESLCKKKKSLPQE